MVNQLVLMAVTSGLTYTVLEMVRFCRNNGMTGLFVKPKFNITFLSIFQFVLVFHTLSLVLDNQSNQLVELSGVMYALVLIKWQFELSKLQKQSLIEGKNDAK